MKRRFSFNYNISFVYVLFISYFIFLVTNGIGNLKYGNEENLNFVKNKFSETEAKHEYLIKNMSIGNIEDNNREILYLEEMRSEILENVEREGDFWLVDLKNLIKQKEDILIKKFLDNDKKDRIKNHDYVKLKNQIEEYNSYYSLKVKPFDFTESIFIKYFMLVFNSRIHQCFLTSIILVSCFIIISSRSMMRFRFLKVTLLILTLMILVQIISMGIWILMDKNFDMFYPTRIVKGFIYFDNTILDEIIPFYKVVLHTFFIEILYVIFILSLIGIVTLIFNSYFLRIASISTLLLSMLGLMFTRFSGISIFSYGKFFDIARGYEPIIKLDEFLNMNGFIIVTLCTVFMFFIFYIYKKYILGERYI